MNLELIMTKAKQAMCHVLQARIHELTIRIQMMANIYIDTLRQSKYSLQFTSIYLEASQANRKELKQCRYKLKRLHKHANI